MSEDPQRLPARRALMAEEKSMSVSMTWDSPGKKPPDHCEMAQLQVAWHKTPRQVGTLVRSSEKRTEWSERVGLTGAQSTAQQQNTESASVSEFVEEQEQEYFERAEVNLHSYDKDFEFIHTWIVHHWVMEQGNGMIWLPHYQDPSGYHIE